MKYKIKTKREFGKEKIDTGTYYAPDGSILRYCIMDETGAIFYVDKNWIKRNIDDIVNLSISGETLYLKKMKTVRGNFPKLIKADIVTDEDKSHITRYYLYISDSLGNESLWLLGDTRYGYADGTAARIYGTEILNKIEEIIMCKGNRMGYIYDYLYKKFERPFREPNGYIDTVKNIREIVMHNKGKK